MERKKLDERELNGAMSGLKDWAVSGTEIKRRFNFDDFASSLEFVIKVGELAEAADHHPDICFGWAYAEISLTTHDRGGITQFDTDLAKKIDRIPITRETADKIN